MQKYILDINCHSRLLEDIKLLREQEKYQGIKLLILTDDLQRFTDVDEANDPIVLRECNFSDDDQLASIIQEFEGQIEGIAYRGDKQVQNVRRVIKHLPATIPAPTEQSLKNATNKQLMRKHFLDYAPEITPNYIEVQNADSQTLDSIEEHLDFPVIVKPANLMSSLLIQSCTNRNELENTLRNVFSTIQEIYKREHRQDDPQVIVEEFLVGDFYSIDAFVTDPETVYYCPPVGYIASKQIGIDDFSLYKRFIPTTLTTSEINDANETVKKALRALDLQYSAAHAELILTQNGWKVIEVGPRLGRFRHDMYMESYGIVHGVNDLLIRMNEVPVIPEKFLQYCSAYTIYPKQEGKLKKLHGMEILEGKSWIKKLAIIAKEGDDCRFAKNGGHALAEFIVSTSDKAEFERITQAIETTIWAETL